ncbi:MAG: pyridoxamine 5'-phosphate oxidase [Betaproteobacteria bacterium]|nr:MAG: pyridoxamine 5'-phosphate oxidase [Betaproteobacteria bacterium]
MKTFAEIAFTPAVQALQERGGSRAACARAQHAAERGQRLGSREMQHLARADSFYMATVGETGWPYVQHRGGSRGFLKTLGPSQVAFADFGGNRQFVSVGNASRDDRVAIIVVDYPSRRRLKLFGRIRFVPIEDADPALASALAAPDGGTPIERVATIDVEAFDWNCPQHITPRYTLAEVDAATQRLRERIAQLEDQLAALRGDAALRT